MTYALPAHDERTCRPILPKAQLEHGAYYKGRCRNATIARWDATKQYFVHWREKFSAIFLESIKHPDDEEFYDVFRVVAKIPDPPFTIPLESADNYDTPFAGDLTDLNAFNTEMWTRAK